MIDGFAYVHVRCAQALFDKFGAKTSKVAEKCKICLQLQIVHYLHCDLQMPYGFLKIYPLLN